MNLDHVTIAASDLDRLSHAFARYGLEPEYGGPHANGVTHMAALGFRDGSYIELISFLQPSGATRFWPEMIAADAGPCAWCVAVDDLHGESARLAALGVPVEGPLPFERRRPDGTNLQWDLSFPGEDSPGSLLPFLIHDRTPRALRISPSRSAIDSSLSGIGMVLIAVRDLAAATALFRRCFHWSAPLVQEDLYLQGTVAFFPGTPVALVQADDGKLKRRTQRWGDLPAAFGINSEDFEAACRQFPIDAVTVWQHEEGPRRLGWFRPAPSVLLAVISHPL